jgi:leader peptidase (prepilin peptidase)/N-methyltransferase
MIVLLLIVIGLILGSFLTATVWRLHEQTKKNTKQRSKQLSITKGHSICPNCGHRLAATDLIPVISWMMLKGRCRYCHKPIGKLEPIIEVLTAAVFVFSYVFWPLPFHGFGLFEFVLWILFLTGFIALFIYDARWFILPDKIIFPMIGLALIQVLGLIIFFNGGKQTALGALWGVLISSGLFYVLFQISKGKWIGGGDVKLGVVLGLLVGGPLSSILLLFMASTLGSIYSIPLLARHKAKPSTQLPFGPFLIVAVIITRLFGAGLIAWYKRLY